MKKNRFITICLIGFAASGCRNAAQNVRLVSVERGEIYAANQKPNPLNLIVGITEDGKLSLNKIETGTISDLTILSEKLKIIFDDREKKGITEREITIDPQGKVSQADLEKLIEILAAARAAPIRVIKNDKGENLQ